MKRFKRFFVAGVVSLALLVVFGSAAVAVYAESGVGQADVLSAEIADAETDVSTGTDTETPNADGTDAQEQTTTLPDDQAPLADNNAETVDEPTGSTLLIVLSSLLFIIIVAAMGWLLLRHARY
jgi:hypothetical protein